MCITIDWGRRHLALVYDVDPDRSLADCGRGASVVAVVLLRADLKVEDSFFNVGIPMGWLRTILFECDTFP